MMIKNQNISLTSKVYQCEGNFVSDMDGEKVMLNINNGKYYNLGEIGGFIWECICSPVKVNQIVTELMNRYDVEQNLCEAHVLEYLNQLSDEKLIKIGD